MRCPLHGAGTPSSDVASNGFAASGAVGLELREVEVGPFSGFGERPETAERGQCAGRPTDPVGKRMAELHRLTTDVACSGLDG